MQRSHFTALATWLAEAGLAGRPEDELLTGFCERALEAGLPLATGFVVIDTLHPVHEGHVIRWYRDKATEMTDYGRTTQGGQPAESWQRSPFYRMLQTGETRLRRRLTPEADGEFSVLAELRAQGMTDYVALISRFAEAGVIGEMDCVLSRWSTDRAGGFDDADLAALEGLLPHLALAIKCCALAGIARTLVQTYLGRDAGRRVLAGQIGRGLTDRIDAVLWFSDLRGYTRITDTARPEQIVPLLNDYAEVVITAVHAEGGDVLKLIGDGVLAIFRAGERHQACAAALAAAGATGRGIAALNRERRALELPATELYLGLHVGEVFFGNIGSAERLDFTVVGPAVNEVSRIAALCRSVDQPLLLSAAFAAALGQDDRRLASVGRYALRGVRQPQELFTLDLQAEA